MSTEDLFSAGAEDTVEVPLALLGKCRSLTEQYVVSRMSGMFDNADEKLYEISESTGDSDAKKKFF